MSQDAQARYQQLLAQLGEMSSKQPELALKNLDKLLAQRPGDPNFLHIRGLSLASLKRQREAIDAMRASLKVHAAQPECHNNLGNSYNAVGDVARAEHHYREALQLQPSYTVALKNLGLLLATDKPDEAMQLLLKALELAPGDVTLLTALGNLHREQERYQDAIRYYRAAIERNPGYVNAVHNLGLSYKLDEQPSEACHWFERAAALAPQQAEIDLNWGNAAFELGDYEKAASLYRRAITKSPGYVLAHETLSELQWQLGNSDRFTESYREALAQRPDDMALRHSLVQLLINSQHFAEARELINESLKFGRTAELLRASGELYANDRDYARAREGFEGSLALQPSQTTTHDFARLLVIEGDYPRALALLEDLRKSDPDNQLTWALIGTCWRLMGDERYQWLIDYQRDVRVLTLNTPPGYTNLTSFLEELQEVLLGMHSTRAAPMRQTLVSGTQTPGRLLHKPNPVIQAYRQVLTEAVAEFVAGMPDDAEHPLFSRKSSRFDFSGSWSVRLYSGGYHVNHVHPEGWISSACYIHLPQSMTASSGTAGCIKFGETPLGLGEREVVERTVHPQPGQLALFPSYAWHGTYDFEAEEGDYRLTAPFDVVPLT